MPSIDGSLQLSFSFQSVTQQGHRFSLALPERVDKVSLA